ncbi:hypothetical protein DNTS_003214, partial [Danionella cerebrum]
ISSSSPRERLSRRSPSHNELLFVTCPETRSPRATPGAQRTAARPQPASTRPAEHLTPRSPQALLSPALAELMAEEAGFGRAGSFHPEDSSLALPQADRLTLEETHRQNRLQQQVQLTLSRKRKKAKPPDSSLLDSLSRCQISSSSSLGSFHLKRTFSVNHETTRSFQTVDRGQWSSLELPQIHKSYGSFRYTSKRAGLRLGSNSFTLPSAATNSLFQLNKLPLRYAHSEVLQNQRCTGLKNKNKHPEDTDEVFLPPTQHNGPAERNRMEMEKHTLQRGLWKHREGGLVALEQSHNVPLQRHGRKYSLEHVAGRRPSQPESPLGLEEMSGSLGRIEKLEVKHHAIITTAKKGRQGESAAEMTLKEAVNLLAQDNVETQITAANFIQNQCFNSPDAKKKILYLQGIPKLLKLMLDESEELQRAAVSALRNIVYDNNENKMEVKECEGFPVILGLLTKNRDIETRRQLTGLLWNLSSHDLLKEKLAREAAQALTNSVLVPCSGISEGEDPKLELLADPDIFYNASGCLRNLSSSGPDGRKAMRDCEGLVECIIYYIRGTIADYKPDDKATENCVCILHNLSYRFDCEVPRVDSPVVLKPRQTHSTNHQTTKPGCFILSTPQGLEISQAIAHFIVQKEGGLSQVKKMLQEGEKEEIRISVSLLKNITRYPELHAHIVKQVLPELVAILPNSDRGEEQTIEVTVTICQILTNLSHVSVPNSTAIINQGALAKIISISTKDNGFGPTRAGQAACVLLHALWRHSDLHSILKKTGYRKTDFINNRTVKAVNSAHA